MTAGSLMLLGTNGITLCILFPPDKIKRMKSSVCALLGGETYTSL